MRQIQALGTKVKSEKIVKQIKRLIYASDAFQQAEDLLAHILSQGFKVNDVLYNPMMAGVITTYGMNFNAAKGVGPLPSVYEKFESKKHKNSHEQIIDARNQLYAHRDIHNTKDKMEGLYKIEVWIDSGQILFRPTMMDISPDRIADMQALISFQRERLGEDLDRKLSQVLDKTKSYNENERWELGRDFP